MPVCLSICLLMKLSRYPPLVHHLHAAFQANNPERKKKVSGVNQQELCIIIVIIFIIIIIIIRKRGIGEVK